MKLTYVDVLTVLPVDVTLQDYLPGCALPLPLALDWTNAVSTSRAIIAAMSDAAAVTGLSSCSSDLLRAFWLLVYCPKLFERACDVDYADSQVG